MKRTLVNCALLFTLVTVSIASDNYQVGDTLYVWAKSGLILREGPSVKFARIDALGFGSPVVVVAKSEEPFNVQAFTPAPKDYLIGRVEPVIFYGHWVEVRTSSGQVGYIIDQYLLHLIPEINKKRNKALRIAQVSFDTLIYNPMTEDGTILETITQYTYQMQSSFMIYDKGNSSTFHFTNLTIEEAIILFLASVETQFPIHVYRNWANHISIFINECHVEFELKGNIVKGTMGCSC